MPRSVQPVQELRDVSTMQDEDGVIGTRRIFVGDGCDDINGVLFNDGRVLYEFQLTEAERAAVAEGKNIRVWLWTGGRGPQPIGVAVEGVDNDA